MRKAVCLQGDDETSWSGRMALKLLRHVHACKGGSVKGGLGQAAMCSWVASLPQVASSPVHSSRLPASALLARSLAATQAEASKARDCLTLSGTLRWKCRDWNDLAMGQTPPAALHTTDQQPRSLYDAVSLPGSLHSLQAPAACIPAPCCTSFI